MHLGNIQAAAGRLQEALEALQLSWQKTADAWHDERSQFVEEKQLRPLAEQVIITVPAIGHMSQVLATAARELNE
ncbi:MAG: hypothetical protein R3C01_18450 [Planctomycetaceae bacterium]